MFHIVKLVQSHAPLGPWILLYPIAFVFSNSVDLQSWAFAPLIPVNVANWALSFAFRLPILCLDSAIAGLIYLCVRGVGGAAKGRVACLAWFANPYAFLASELLGVPDLLATLLFLAGIVMFVWRRPLLSGILLALGIWTKFYPALTLVPVLIFGRSSGLPRKHLIGIALLGAIGLIAYGLWTASNWYGYVATYSPVSQPMVLLGGEATVNFAAFALVVFYFIIAMFGRSVKNVVDLVVPTLLVYYAVSSPAPQYLVWIMPLMIIDIVVWNRSRAWLFALFYILGFAQWFLTSSALLTPSGYSLLLIPLVGGNALTAFLESYSETLVSEVISSAFYAMILLYLIDGVRSWFKPVPPGLEGE